MGGQCCQQSLRQLYRPSGSVDMRRAETTAMTWWGTPGLYCHSSAVLIQPGAVRKHWGGLRVLICVFSLRALSSVMLPQWKPASDLYKKRVMPTSCCPQACPFCLRGEGPHNLLFVPLLLRKYFLNSSFFVYFYYSCFLPWFTPPSVLIYLLSKHRCSSLWPTCH